MPVEIVGIGALFMLSFVVEGAEAAFLSVSDIKLRTLARKGDRKASAVLAARKDVPRLLGALLLAQKFCDVGSSSVVAVLATERFGSAGLGVAAGAMTFVSLIFLNLIPKSIGASDPLRWTMALARPVALSMKALSPVLWAVDRVTRLFAKGGATAALGEEDIRTMAIAAASAGDLERHEGEMIERVFLFNDITAHDVMTPKDDIVFLDASMSVAEAASVMNATGFSRYPLRTGADGPIAGIVYLKDVFVRLSRGPADEVARLPIAEFAGPAPEAPETERIDDLFRRFQKDRVHMAIVTGAGGVVGLVTIEDLLEELVGEISDETDIDEHIIKRIDRSTILVRGDIPIESVNRFLNAHIVDAGHRTIGRLIASKSGGRSAAGAETRLADGITAVVERMGGRRILRVRVMKRDPAA